jgi:hypothetical protein
MRFLAGGERTRTRQLTDRAVPVPGYVIHDINCEFMTIYGVRRIFPSCEIMLSMA